MASFKFLDYLNIAKTCKLEFNVPVWKCPTFLFILMGAMTIVSTLSAYYLAATYSSDPEMLGALASLVTAAIIFVIGHVIIQSFTQVLEVDRLKAQFLNIVSHQLLTPLTSLKWSVSMLENESLKSDKEKLEEAFVMIKENSNKMIRIINALLDVSRIESGRVLITPERLDIAKLASEVIASRANELEARRHKLEVDMEGLLPFVFADPTRVRMVLENLIDNAIKYSRTDSQISVALRKEGKLVAFEIKDTGAGIPKRERKHIFKKFFRASNDINLQTKGLGVGLFLVKFIIEASGGKVDFESEEGVGSKFRFLLPAYYNK